MSETTKLVIEVTAPDNAELWSARATIAAFNELLHKGLNLWLDSSHDEDGAQYWYATLWIDGNTPLMLSRSEEWLPGLKEGIKEEQVLARQALTRFGTLPAILRTLLAIFKKHPDLIAQAMGWNAKNAEKRSLTRKTPAKTRARELQQRTGWSYSECLRLVRLGVSEEELQKLIAQRKAGNG